MSFFDKDTQELDMGIGIDEKAILHVFERFYRGDESYSKKIEESGLGFRLLKVLWICIME